MSMTETSDSGMCTANDGLPAGSRSRATPIRQIGSCLNDIEVTIGPKALRFLHLRNFVPFVAQ